MNPVVRGLVTPHTPREGAALQASQYTVSAASVVRVCSSSDVPKVFAQPALLQEGYAEDEGVDSFTRLRRERRVAC